jgi:hypothetical protein
MTITQAQCRRLVVVRLKDASGQVTKTSRKVKLTA